MGEGGREKVGLENLQGNCPGDMYYQPELNAWKKEWGRGG